MSKKKIISNDMDLTEEEKDFKQMYLQIERENDYDKDMEDLSKRLEDLKQYCKNRGFYLFENALLSDFKELFDKKENTDSEIQK